MALLSHSNGCCTTCKELGVQVEQAIFTSIRAAQRQGYHLVGRSAGVDETLAQSLTLWCPTHAGLVEENTAESSISFFPAGDEWLALTRTVYGGPEYSGRGGRQVVTLLLLLRREQLACYDGDPLRVVRLAQCLGHLRLPAVWQHQLPTVDLPENSVIGSHRRAMHCSLNPFSIDRAARLLREQQRVALLGVHERGSVLECLLAQLSPRQRMALSFTTGLRPSLQRPFALHILPKDDVSLRQQLATQEVFCLTA